MARHEHERASEAVRASELRDEILTHLPRSFQVLHKFAVEKRESD